MSYILPINVTKYNSSSTGSLSMPLPSLPWTTLSLIWQHHPLLECQSSERFRYLPPDVTINMTSLPSACVLSSSSVWHHCPLLECQSSVGCHCPLPICYHHHDCDISILCLCVVSSDPAVVCPLSVPCYQYKHGHSQSGCLLLSGEGLYLGRTCSGQRWHFDSMRRGQGCHFACPI